MDYTRIDTRLPAAAGYTMPAEWQPHAGCLIGFPCRPEAYGGKLAEARRAQAAVACAIADFEPVTMLCRPEDEAAARPLLSGDITLLPLPIDDSWLRDSGPTYLLSRSGDRAGIDWLFNAWGAKYIPWAADDALAGDLLRRQQTRRFIAPLVLEGGSIHTNGAGVILTTEQCLLHPNRNPRLNRADIEQLLCGYLGAEHILWLAGDRRDDETDGHIDNIACFAGETHILLMTDPGDATLSENHRRIQQARTASGGRYDLTLLPHPHLQENGTDLLASYINFYYANGAVIMPSFGVAEDSEARAIMADIFPRRKIVSVAVTDIVRGGGGIHCITQQVPKGEVAG